MKKVKINLPKEPRQPSRKEMSDFINKKYDQFESGQFPIAQACCEVEAEILQTKSRLLRLNILRNDMSRNMGRGKERFNRIQHTHQLANF